MSSSQKKLGENFSGVTDSIVGLTAKLDTKDKKDPDPDTGPSSRDIETMSRGDYTKHLLGEVGKLIKTEVKPIDEKIEGESMTRKQSDVANQVSKAEKDHKDLWDWKEELGTMAKEHPTLNVEKLYKLVRAEDPSKAEKLDEKYTEGEADPKAKEEAGFGGLFPNSGNLSSEELAKERTSEEAGELAWEKTMAGVALPSE